MFKLSLILERDEARAWQIVDFLEEVMVPSASAISLFEQAERAIQVEAYFEKKPDPITFSADLKNELGFVISPSLIRVEAVKDRGWVAEFERTLFPVRSGRFLIHGSHHRHCVLALRTKIEIDAAQAFGTAHHGTTQGCLLALDRLMHAHFFETILDIGTGTGVLAIAAAKALPSASVIATDIDSIAVAIARENCKKNQVASNVTVIKAANLQHQMLRALPPHDLIMANILANPLRMLAQDITRKLKRGGFAILSGMLDEQARWVFSAYGQFGFSMMKRISLDGWTTLIIRKR